jgi:hypothetical protein
VREPFPTSFDEALKAAGAELEAERQRGVPVAETWLEWMQKRFREAYALGRDGEQMLAEVNADSERASTTPLDNRGRSEIAALNELRVHNPARAADNPDTLKRQRPARRSARAANGRPVARTERRPRRTPPQSRALACRSPAAMSEHLVDGWPAQRQRHVQPAHKSALRVRRSEAAEGGWSSLSRAAEALSGSVSASSHAHAFPIESAVTSGSTSSDDPDGALSS